MQGNASYSLNSASNRRPSDACALRTQKGQPEKCPLKCFFQALGIDELLYARVYNSSPAFSPEKALKGTFCQMTPGICTEGTAT
jgi:hypothetical protein